MGSGRLDGYGSNLKCSDFEATCQFLEMIWTALRKEFGGYEIGEFRVTFFIFVP